MAEAGSGKSRRVFDLKAKDQSGWTVLEAFSVSHGKAGAYLEEIDLPHAYFNIKPEDEVRKRVRLFSSTICATVLLTGLSLRLML